MIVIIFNFCKALFYIRDLSRSLFIYFFFFSYLIIKLIGRVSLERGNNGNNASHEYYVVKHRQCVLPSLLLNKIKSQFVRSD